MGMLSKPEKDLATRILSEVDFENRLIGYRLRERAGALSTTMYCFEEVATLLADPYPVLDLDELEKWVREVIEDEELADNIAIAVKRENSDHDRYQLIGKLMEERLIQCKKTGL